MTPREIFACSAWVEKLKADDCATELAIATAAAAYSAGAKGSDDNVNRMQADFADFEPV